jgi:uncharacterized protein YggE
MCQPVWVAVAIGAILSVITPAPVGAQDVAAQVPTIVTSGEAVLRRPPDQAFVAVTIESRAKSVRDAQGQNATAASAVRKRLEAAGLQGDAIRTLGYYLHEDVDHADGRRVSRGYVARNTFEVRLDDIERTGEVIDSAVQAGATSIGGVRFELKDRRAAEREALRLAVADARERADAAAAAIGRAVDRVIRVEEGSPGVPAPRPMPGVQVFAQSAAMTNVEPGTIEVRAQATVTVSMK